MLADLLKQSCLMFLVILCLTGAAIGKHRRQTLNGLLFPTADLIRMHTESTCKLRNRALPANGPRATFALKASVNVLRFLGIRSPPGVSTPDRRLHIIHGPENPRSLYAPLAAGPPSESIGLLATRTTCLPSVAMFALGRGWAFPRAPPRIASTTGVYRSRSRCKKSRSLGILGASRCSKKGRNPGRRENYLAVFTAAQPVYLTSLRATHPEVCSTHVA